MEPLGSIRFSAADITGLAAAAGNAFWQARYGGDHDVYKHPTRPGRIILPRHRTLSPGVVRAIAKQARWVD